MTKNFARILKLAENLSDAPKNGFLKSEVVDSSGLPASTVYRLLTEMQQSGYIYTTSEGRLLPNFLFERRIEIGRITLEQLRHTCASVSAQLQCASEIILLRGQNLLWHITDEHKMQPIKLRAHPGYVRPTYELDSISRLALAHCDIEEIENSWELSGFYDVGVQGKQLNWNEARTRILATKKNAMQFDMQGNAKGIRRFSIAIKDAADKFVCLLTIAEAATPVRDAQAHIDSIRTTLEQAKEILELGNSNKKEEMDFGSLALQKNIE